MAMVMDMAMKAKCRLITTLPPVLLSCVAGVTFAQQPLSTGTPMSSSGGPENSSYEATLQPAWIIKPRISLTETLSDNVAINRSSTAKESDLITELAPGIRIQAKTARLTGYFDYTLRGQFYAKTDYSRTQNALNTFGTFEAVDNWLFLDFSGMISQQAISAFGAQSPGSGTINNNLTETANYRVSPYIRGQFAGLVDYILRYNTSITRSETDFVSDIELSQWVGQLRGSTPFRVLGWAIDGSQQTVDYSRGRKTEATSLRTMLNYIVTPEFRVSLSGGTESNNYASLNQETNTTYGYGFDWNPTERTQLSAFKERRFFGDGHNLRFSHRFPMSSIQLSDTRDVSVLPNQFSTVGLGTIYDMYFEQFAALIPDTTARANYVNALLAQSGINPNTQVTSGYTTSQATIRRNQQLTFVMFGARNSVTMAVNRTESQSVIASSLANNLGDDFSNFRVVRQQGLSFNLSHRLSQLSNLNFLVSLQESKGGNANDLKTTMTLYQLNLSTKLGAKTAGSLSLRHSEFDSTTNPYTENAVIGTISYVY